MQLFSLRVYVSLCFRTILRRVGPGPDKVKFATAVMYMSCRVIPGEKRIQTAKTVNMGVDQRRSGVSARASELLSVRQAPFRFEKICAYQKENPVVSGIWSISGLSSPKVHRVGETGSDTGAVLLPIKHGKGGDRT